MEGSYRGVVDLRTLGMKALLKNVVLAIHPYRQEDRDVGDHSMSDEHRHRARGCLQRKLPSIPPSRRLPDIHPPDKRDLQLLTGHNQITSNALSSSETRPKLVKAKKCDKLYNFVSEIAFTKGMESVSSRTDNAREKSNTKQTRIPSISISRAAERRRSSVGRAQDSKVYVCGNINDEKWAMLVLELSQYYFVRCIAEQSQDPAETSRAILQADVFIFLMDNQSMCNSECIEQLEAALELDMKIIFVRESNLRRPDTLVVPKAPVVRHNADYAKDDHTLYPNGQLFGNGERTFIKRSFAVPKQVQIIQSDERLLHIDQMILSERARSCSLRPSSSTSMSSCRSAPEFRGINKTMADTGTRENLYATQSSPNGLSTCTLPSTPSTGHNAVDVATAIYDGYNAALIYETNHQREAANLLRSAIDRPREKRNASCKQWCTCTPTPTPTQSPNISRNHSPFVETEMTSPEPEYHFPSMDNDNSGDESESDFSSSDTVYVIYSSENETAGAAKVFHWPADCANDGIPSSPSIDSFGFEDIDLAMAVNNLDLAGSDSDSVNFN